MMSNLLVADQYGRTKSYDSYLDDGAVISTGSQQTTGKPKLGNAYGAWAGRDLYWLTLPTGTQLQFDLSKLTLGDYRQMREHYQIGASLTVLAFMLHQIDWHIECEDSKIRDMITDNLAQIWTPLVKAMSQAHWAGYSPAALDYDNGDKYVTIKQVKDLVPEECIVNWRTVEGYAPEGHTPPKFKVYDGIKQYGNPIPIPPISSLWYPMAMENGDYYGRKLLKPAFAPWFFSNLIHMFSNRYYERFGEPTPVGRADFDETFVQADGTTISGRKAMENVLINLRSRGVVVLPSERDPETKEYLNTVEYLESQMRGADFERYLTRLDEEMSLSIFTPFLLFRTADVGSYNLGTSHMQLFLWMLNSLAADMKLYIDDHIVNRLARINFGEKAPRVQWKFRAMGKDNVDTIRAIMTGLVTAGRVMPDLEELGRIIGLDLEEIEEIVEPPSDPNADPAKPGARGGKREDKRGTRVRPERAGAKTGPGKPKSVVAAAYIVDMVALGYTREQAEIEIDALFRE